MSVGHGGLYHSQSPEGYFMGATGLKVRILFNIQGQYKLVYVRSSFPVPQSKQKVYYLAQYGIQTLAFSWNLRFYTDLQ